MARYSDCVNIEYDPTSYDYLFKSINTHGEDLNFCVYELIYREQTMYTGNGRLWFSQSGKYILSKSRPLSHKNDDFDRFVHAHENECTIRISCANKTKQQVVTLEALLIKIKNPPLNKIRGAEGYIHQYLNV